MPIRQFAGQYDNTAGTDGPKKTQADLEKMGAKDSTLEIMDTDHAGLSTKPWTDTDLLPWFLKQSRMPVLTGVVHSADLLAGSGSSGSGSSQSATESSDQSATTTYSPVSPPNSTSDSGSGEDECEEDDETVESSGEDDCEEEDESAPADDEDDCEDDDETYDDEEDEDCGTLWTFIDS